MALKLTNNGIGRLAANVAIGDTTISLTPGDGAKFPALGAGDYCPATLIRASDGAIEIVKVTARSSDALTVERAQESTSAKAFVAGDRLELRHTAQTILDHLTEAATHAATSKATPVDADEIPLVDSADSNKLKKLTWASLKAGVLAAIGAVIAAATSKDTPVDADAVLLSDSAASGANKKLTWANIKAGIFSAWGALINGGTAKTTPADADAIAIMDSAASNATKKLTFASLKAWLLSFTSANVASAATVDLTGYIGKTAHITGTTAISAFTMSAGQVIDLIFDGVLTLTHHANTNNLPGSANITTAAGDRARYFYDGATVWCMNYTRENGKPVIGGISIGTAVASTSGTAIDFTGIPNSAKQITLNLSGVSTNGTSLLLVQIGDAGGVETSSYAGCTQRGTNFTTHSSGWVIDNGAGAANSVNGSLVISLIDPAANLWCCEGVLGLTGVNFTTNLAGSKSLSPGPLDRIRLTTINGTDVFDAGTVNIIVG